MRYIGIDISKKDFTVAFPKEDGGETRVYDNTPKGIREFIRRVNPSEHHCVMEATGNYGMLLLYLLGRSGIVASMENPYKVRNFARAMLTTVKTDKLDARIIALYGEKMQPAPFRLKGDAILLLKQKRTVIRQFRKQMTATSNMRDSLEVLPLVDRHCIKAIDDTIKFLKKKIDDLEGELAGLARQEFRRQMELLTSIKGIGVKLAAALIIATGGFSYFDNAKQVSRYFGLSPCYQQSGTSINVKGHINRNGDSYIRGQLYIASWVAMRYNAKCKETYERLRSRGKPAKVALIAVANKLVRQAYAVVTQDREYVDGFCSEKP